ncbi:MAG TPA: cupin domain-containing protein [Verrucomicrobiae bacterium]|nr:cupin domain-containing protein [Verrucomicrobiae bacterium]
MSGLEILAEAQRLRQPRVVESLLAPDFVQACTESLADEHLFTDELVTMRRLGVHHNGHLTYPNSLQSFHELRAQGHGFIVLSIDRISEQANGLRRTVAERLVGDIVMALYMSEADHSTIRPHYDDRDVLWTQLDGEKRVRLGLDAVPVDMTPGDALFILRGIPHTAEALSGSRHVCSALQVDEI